MYHFQPSEEPHETYLYGESCHRELCKQLEYAYRVLGSFSVYEILEECSRYRAAYRAILEELTSHLSAPQTLMSLLNEVRQFGDRDFREAVRREVDNPYDQVVLNEAEVLLAWLNMYEMWSRAIT